MERLDALYKAGEIARAMVVINNAIATDLATYQPERDSVQFYAYDAEDGSSVEHFRFEATRHEYTITNVLGAFEVWRGNQPERALSVWASHILGYVNQY